MLTIDISTFDIGRYIMASMSGLVLIIGLFVIGIGVNIKKDENFVSLGYSIMFIAMGKIISEKMMGRLLFLLITLNLLRFLK